MDMEKLKILQGGNGEIKSDHLKSLYNKKLHYQDQRDELKKLVEANEKNIQEMEKDIRSRTDPEDYFVNSFFHEKHLSAEIADKIISDRHQVEISNELWSRFESNEDVLMEAMKLNRHLYLILSGMNRVSDELKEKVSSFQRIVEGKKTVIWRDHQTEKVSLFQKHEIENVYKLPFYMSTPRTPPSQSKGNGNEGLETICSGLTPTLSSYTEHSKMF